jgi:hypothetical protein
VLEAGFFRAVWIISSAIMDVIGCVLLLVMLCVDVVKSARCGGQYRECRCEDLERMVCYGMGLARIPDYGVSVNRRIKSLDLRGNMIRRIKAHELDHLPRLESLDVRYQQHEACVIVPAALDSNILVKGSCEQVIHVDVIRGLCG